MEALRQRAVRRRIVLVVTVVIAAVVLSYLGRVAVLFLGAHEGDVPSASLIPEPPTGVQVVSEGKECASGGCWWQVVLQPAQGQSPANLAAEMGVATERRLSGDFLDPRPVNLWSSATATELRVYVSY